MARRVRREYVDDGGDAVYEDRRSVLAWNPVSTIVGLLLLAALIWAIFWGPIGEMFDGDDEPARFNTPNVQVNE